MLRPPPQRAWTEFRETGQLRQMIAPADLDDRCVGTRGGGQKPPRRQAAKGRPVFPFPPPHASGAECGPLCRRRARVDAVRVDSVRARVRRVPTCTDTCLAPHGHIKQHSPWPTMSGGQRRVSGDAREWSGAEMLSIDLAVHACLWLADSKRASTAWLAWSLCQPE